MTEPNRAWKTGPLDVPVPAGDELTPMPERQHPPAAPEGLRPVLPGAGNTRWRTSEGGPPVPHDFVPSEPVRGVSN